MRHPPPAAWESSCAGVWAVSHGLLAGLSWMGLMQTALHHGLVAWGVASAWALPGVWLLASLSGCGLAWFVHLRVRRTPSVRWAWDGAAWSCDDPRVPPPSQIAATPRLVFDLGPWLLVQMAHDSQGRLSRWWVFRAPDAGASPTEQAAWHLWRTALMAARPAAASGVEVQA